MKPTTYVLDVSKWRCGLDSYSPKIRLGIGPTLFLNEKGYSCCLGQFAAQKLRKRGKSRESASTLIGGVIPSPAVLAVSLGGVMYDSNFVERCSDDGDAYNTHLATELLLINDSKSTTVREKIDKIRAALKAHGHTLRVINQHYLP